jgi:hypothetical protein
MVHLELLNCVFTGFSSTGAGRLTGPDGNEMDTEAFLASLTIVTSDDAIEDKDGKTIIAAGGVVPFRLVSQKYGRGIVDYGKDIVILMDVF